MGETVKTRSRDILIFVFLIVAIFLVIPASGQKLNSVQTKKADRNKDGEVDGIESRRYRIQQLKKRMEEGIAIGRTIDFRNDTLGRQRYGNLTSDAASQGLSLVENRYDSNHNGILEYEEIRLLLQDKYNLIKSEGKIAVETAFEEAYDLNRDDYVDKEEARFLKDDFKLE